MSPVIIINERSPLSLAKSTQDTTQATATTTKKKKYNIVRAVILSGVGLAGFSVATVARYYSLSSGGSGSGFGGGGGGGIRASVDGMDTLLSWVPQDGPPAYAGHIVPSYAGQLCVQATGTWSGTSFNSDEGPTPFQTCFKYPTGEECWTNSFKPFVNAGWHICWPQGQSWKFLNSGAASSGCGSPCLKFLDMNDEDDDHLNSVDSEPNTEYDTNYVS